MERRDGHHGNNSDDEHDHESSDGRLPSQSNENSDESSNRLTTCLQNLRTGQLRSPRPPPSSPLLQQRNPVLQSLSSPPSQSQSSSQEQSQLPGPSGLHLQNIAGASGSSGIVGSEASLQASAGAMPSLGGQTPIQPRPHIFEISPSQDLLASQDSTFRLVAGSSSQPSGSQHPGHSQAQGSLPYAEGGKPVLPLLIQQHEERRQEQREAEDNLHQFFEQLSARREEVSLQSESSHSQGAYSRPLQQPWQQRCQEAMRRERSRFLARLAGVPGSTDSGMSSDEYSARRAGIRERQEESGVPSPAVTIETPCSRFQEGISTASSDSSSSELLAVPGSSSERKESKRPFQKVPRISTDRKLRIDREQREREKAEQCNTSGAASQPAEEMELETGNSGQEFRQSDDGLSSRDDISGSEGGGGGSRAEGEGGEVLEREGRGSHQSAGDEETESDVWSRPEERAVGEEAATRERLPREPQAQSAQGAGVSQERSGPEEGEGARNRLRRPTDTDTQSEEEYLRGHSRLRGRVVHQRRHGRVYSSSEDTDKIHSRRSVITAAPPTSGADTDCTTEYAGTQTTSSSASTESDSASTEGLTTASSGRQSGSVDSDTPYQTLPLSSTPEDVVMMPPPSVPRGFTSKRRRTSDENTMSTSTTSSSSVGMTEKMKCTRFGVSGSLENIAEADVPTEKPEPTLESQEQSPFVLDSQASPDKPHQLSSERDPSEVIPNTPPEGGQAELPPSHTQDEESQDLVHQLPRWMDQMSAKSQGEEEERQSNSQQGFKRPLSQDSSGSVSSNSDQSRSPLPLPPSKRRKTRGSSSSGDVSLRGSREGSSARSSVGLIMQAQPSSVPPSQAPSFKKHISETHISKTHSSSSKGEKIDNCDSSSGASSYAHSSSSSGGRTSGEISSSSSSGKGSTEGSLNQSTSSEGPSGSSGSRGSGSGSQKGSSDSSKGGGSFESGEGGGHEADESTVNSVPSQTPPSMESEDVGGGEGTSQNDSLLKQRPLDPSPGNEAGVSSSGSSSESTQSQSVVGCTTLSQGTKATVSASIEVIEESLVEGINPPDEPVPPTHTDSEAQAEKLPPSSWQLQLSSCSSSSRLADSHTGGQPPESHSKEPFQPIRSECKHEELGIGHQTSSELLHEAPGSPEILQTVGGEEEEQMHCSPEIDLQAPVGLSPHGCDSLHLINTSTPDNEPHKQNSKSLSSLLLKKDAAAEVVDLSHDLMSTQNSFTLHLSQSQASVLTPSFPSNTCETSSSQLHTSLGPGVSYEDGERELVEEGAEHRTVNTSSGIHVENSTEHPTYNAAITKCRPVPTYESLRSDSVSENVISSSISENVRSGSIPEDAGNEKDDHDNQGGVDSPVVRAESQLTLSQLTPSGTPFHFKLPQGDLQPRTCITPPSQRSRSCLFSQMDSNSPSCQAPSHPRAAHLTGDNSANGSVTMLSPSELSSSLFRPITPLQSQQPSGTVENTESQNPVVSNEVDKDNSDVLMDTSECNGLETSTAITRGKQNSNCLLPRVGRECHSVSDNVTHNSEVVSSEGEKQSSRTHTAEQQSVAAIVHVSPATVTESADGNINGHLAPSPRVNSETVKEPHNLTSLSQHSSFSGIAEPSLKSSSPERQTTTQTSPRKSLSLKKTKNSPTPAKLRTASGSSLQSGKTILPIPSGTTHCKSGVYPFVLGVHPPQDEQSAVEQNSCDSQDLLPPINIPNDSQFELSESSRFSPPPFRIERPPNTNHQLTIPPSSTTRHPDTNAKTSIFSNLGASSRKKATSLVTAVSGCSSALGTDPYRFHSQSQNSDVAQFMSKQVRRKDSSYSALPQTVHLASERQEKGDEEERRGGVQEGSEATINCNHIHGSEDGNGFTRSDNGIVSGSNLCQNDENVHPSNPASQDVANSTANTQQQNGSSNGGDESSHNRMEGGYSERAQLSTAPAGQTEAPLSGIVATNPSQHSVPTTDPQQPAANPLPVVGSPPGLEPSTDTPMTSPCLQESVLQFVSPSVVAATLGLEQWVQQTGGGGGGNYEIQYVRTYNIECKVISSQVIKDDRVVAGSERIWQTQDEPRCCQKITLNVIPQNNTSTPTSPSVHTLTTTSSAIAADMMSPAALQLLQSPGLSSLTPMPTISQPLAFFQSPACSSTMGPPTSSSCSTHTQLTGSTTPQVHPQPFLPPIRLVQPVSQTGDPNLTSPRQKQVQPSTIVTNESTDTTAGTVREDAQNHLIEESPFPSVSSRGGVKAQAGKRGKKQAGKLARREKQSPLVTKRMKTRSGGRKHAFDASPPPPSPPRRDKKHQQALTPKRHQTRSLSATTPSRNVSFSSPTTRTRGGHLPGPKSPSRRSNAGHSTPTKPPTSTVEKTQHNTRHEEPIPGPSGTPNVLPSTSSLSPVIQVGSQVVARWRDQHWYMATVTGEAKNGRFHLQYADGDKGSLSASSMFPLDCVREGVAVTALSVPEEDLPEVNGLFCGFVGRGRERFKLVVRGGEAEETCGADRLALPPDSAQCCLEFITMTPKGGRKRGYSAMSLEGESSIVKKRRTSTSPRYSSNNLETEEHPQSQWIFEGYTFLLTLRPKDEASPPPNPVDKDLVSSQIRNRRGKVLETITNERIIDGRFFVVSDTFCRTVKYLLGLALAVPCVSYDWINDNIKQGRVVDYRPYQLPAGVPLGRSTPIPWKPRNRSSVLRGVKVYIDGSSSFKHQWSSILHRAGATNYPKLPSFHQIAKSEEGSSPLGNMVIICEATEHRHISNSLLHRATTAGMKLLSPEWVVQCLICGEALTNYDNFWFDKKQN